MKTVYVWWVRKHSDSYSSWYDISACDFEMHRFMLFAKRSNVR